MRIPLLKSSIFDSYLQGSYLDKEFILFLFPRRVQLRTFYLFDTNVTLGLSIIGCWLLSVECRVTTQSTDWTWPEKVERGAGLRFRCILYRKILLPFGNGRGVSNLAQGKLSHRRKVNEDYSVYLVQELASRIHSICGCQCRI